MLNSSWSLNKCWDKRCFWNTPCFRTTWFRRGCSSQWFAAWSWGSFVPWPHVFLIPGQRENSEMDEEDEDEHRLEMEELTSVTQKKLEFVPFEAQNLTKSQVYRSASQLRQRTARWNQAMRWAQVLAYRFLARQARGTFDSSHGYGDKMSAKLDDQMRKLCCQNHQLLVLHDCCMIWRFVRLF